MGISESTELFEKLYSPSGCLPFQKSLAELKEPKLFDNNCTYVRQVNHKDLFEACIISFFEISYNRLSKKSFFDLFSMIDMYLNSMTKEKKMNKKQISEYSIAINQFMATYLIYYTQKQLSKKESRLNTPTFARLIQEHKYNFNLLIRFISNIFEPNKKEKSYFQKFLSKDKENSNKQECFQKLDKFGNEFKVLFQIYTIEDKNLIRLDFGKKDCNEKIPVLFSNEIFFLYPKRFIALQSEEELESKNQQKTQTFQQINGDLLQEYVIDLSNIVIEFAQIFSIMNSSNRVTKKDIELVHNSLIQNIRSASKKLIKIEEPNPSAWKVQLQKMKDSIPTILQEFSAFLTKEKIIQSVKCTREGKKVQKFYNKDKKNCCLKCGVIRSDLLLLHGFHKYCKNCFKEYLISTNNRKMAAPFQCPVPNCDALIPSEISRAFGTSFCSFCEKEKKFFELLECEDMYLPISYYSFCKSCTEKLIKDNNLPKPMLIRNLIKINNFLAPFSISKDSLDDWIKSRQYDDLVDIENCVSSLGLDDRMIFEKDLSSNS